MLGITRRDYWAFLTGTALVVTVLGFLSGTSRVFLFGAVLLGFDIFMYLQNREGVK